jgi:CheY-like chemotaxis protein
LELGLPVTLLAAHALLVRVGGQVLALSNRGVEEIFYPGAGELQKMGSNSVYRIGDNAYEARHLDIMLNLSSDRQDEERQSNPVLLIEEESGTKTAILVQEVLDSRDLVVKPLGQYVPHVIGVMGGAILGDGSVTPVLDLPELLQTQKVAPQVVRTSGAQAKNATRVLPTVLVVDDSLSARRSLAQFVRDLGYEVQTAQDGFEAVTLIEGARPDIILADLEMPRMNGLELTSHLRAQEETKDIPVIMITSRSTEKHRAQADRAGVTAYVTKPFSEEVLLQHIGTALG